MSHSGRCGRVARSRRWTTCAMPHGGVPRDLALSVFRRHLNNIQVQVRESFEHYDLSGLQSARRLARLAHGRSDRGAVSLCGQAWPPPACSRCWRWWRPAATGAACWRRSATSTCCSSRPRSRTKALHAVVEFMLYFLWDLGLKVGHATRSDRRVPGGGRARHHRAHLHDGRAPAGMAMPRCSSEFRHVSLRRPRIAAFAADELHLAAKQAERDARHRRYGDSPFVVEPNIKEGRGGLRDLQTCTGWPALRVRRRAGPAAWTSWIRADRRRSGSILTLTARRIPQARRSWDFPVDGALPPALRRRDAPRSG